MMRVLTVQNTILSFTILALSLSLTGIAKAQTAAPQLEHAAVGRDPFNRVQAKDTAGFVWHLQRNAALRAKYARHFGIPEGEVVSFVKNALVLSTMQEDTNMTTFGVASDGSIYPAKTRLKKGTKVWATREGVPVLKWSCSNPLEWKLPGQELREKPYRVTVTPNSVVPPETPLTVSVPENLTIPVSKDDSGSAMDVTRLAVVPNEPVFAPLPEVIGSVPNVPSISSGFGGVGPAALGALFLPLVLGTVGGGGGKTNVVAVPEANTIVMLSLGLLASGATMVIKRRRTK